ncbi:MAG: ABC transporter substrate-binding protein [Deltaproteobacteria bacterium]|nr:ABC transporter substrate-binding protein [Deltaproteobacteria bacterium]
MRPGGSRKTVNTEFGKRRPDVVVKFLKAEIRALQWVNNPRNKEEAIRLLLKWLKVDEPTARRTYKYLVEDLKVFSGNGEVDLEGMQVTVDLLAKSGVIKDPKPWTAYADLSFLRQAQRELGGKQP